ncbi:hypothetical protein CCAX7_58880 [Capsulimonas corticalis]|uniref:Uncharacterized protein n=1 Tax=Capsulimonas corticalis TaxID=2219043 RepID=A0A402CZU4_9BACT|nr:hypothetical protein [Capsulimonas corticalis]BDI33837.1 hypothetical protein CCAX7_58880 [Capsulimonas corticalis]
MASIWSQKCNNSGRRLSTALAISLLCAGTFPLCVSNGAAVPTSNAPSYSITDLGGLADVADEATVSLNNAGDVSLDIVSGQHVHAALWSHGRLRDLGDAPGYPNGVPHALNGHNTVVGWTNTSDNPVDSMAATRAFVNDGHGMRVLGTLGGRDSRALGVNDSGRIVGVSNLDDRTRHAFVSDGGGALKDLGALPGGRFSAAYAVNAAGDAAGVADTPGQISHPVCWRKGKIHDLGTLPGGDSGCALAINARGDAAGYSETKDGVHAFLYSRGRMRNLGVLKFDPSAANGLNDSDDVVGTSNVSASARHAFLWRKGRMDDLNDLIAQNTGWTLTAGCAINNAGQIVCIAGKRGEPSHALLLTPIASPRSLPVRQGKE